VSNVEGPRPATSPPKEDLADRDDFAAFAAHFAKAWDARDLPALDATIPKDGFWLIYNVGVAPHPYSYPSLTAVLRDSEEKNFGYAHFVGFDCTPQPGPAPGLRNCTSDGEESFSVCRHGIAKPVLHEAFDFYLMDMAPNKQAERTWAERGREHALAFEKTELRFLSDTARGAVFYFVKPDKWQLIALSTTDCSA